MEIKILQKIAEEQREVLKSGASGVEAIENWLFPTGKKGASEGEAVGGVDGDALAAEGKAEDATGGEEFGEDVAGQIAGSVRRNAVKYIWMTKANARVDPGGRNAATGVVGGAFEEADDAVFGVEGDDAVGFGALVQEKRGEGIFRAMKSEHGGKILVGDDVAVVNEEGIAGAEEGFHFLDAAGSAEELRFLRVNDFDAES